MPVPMWIAVLLVASCFLFAVMLAREGRRVALIHRDNEQLRAMVAHRMERPNVFSHEVRTPLTLIQGAGELLLEETPGPLTDQQKEFVETILDNAAQMSGLADNMLVEARIGAQLVELHRSSVEIRSLVRDTVKDLRRLTHTPVELDNTGWRIYLDADSGLLRQALWNLINNALRHAGENAVVTVQVTESADHVIVSVSDDGTGIDDAERAKLFQPFAADLARVTEESHGTGLGMMVTERIIATHGGRVLVDTIPGHGTTVFCAIPLSQSSMATASSLREQTTKASMV